MKPDQTLMFEIGKPTLIRPDGLRGPATIDLMLLSSGWVRQSGLSPSAQASVSKSNWHLVWSWMMSSLAPSSSSQAAVTLASSMANLAGETQDPGSRAICWAALMKASMVAELRPPGAPSRTPS